MTTEEGCKEVLPKGGDAGSTRYYCEETAEYFCEQAQSVRCLEHSHLANCCQRLYWPSDLIKGDIHDDD